MQSLWKGDVIMTVEEMQAQLDKMKDDIEHMKVKVSEYEHMISTIKAQDDEPIERVPKNEKYFLIGITSGKAVVYKEREDYCDIDADRFYNNNYFKTSERAQEIVDKINFLLKLERLHDTLCPNKGGRYYITYITDSGKYYYGCLMRNIPVTFPISVMFPTEEIAQKVCDILNKERENNDKS